MQASFVLLVTIVKKFLVFDREYGKPSAALLIG